MVVSQKEPQVAIVSLADLAALNELRYRNSSRALLETAQRIRVLLKDEHLPADLATNHDHYLGDDERSDHPNDK